MCVERAARRRVRFSILYPVRTGGVRAVSARVVQPSASFRSMRRLHHAGTQTVGRHVPWAPRRHPA